MICRLSFFLVYVLTLFFIAILPMKTTYFFVKGVFSLTKLQAEFTNYMQIALKHDSIDYFRSHKKYNNLEVFLINEINREKVSVPQISGIGTFHFSKISLSCISDEKLFFAINNLTKRQQKILFMYADSMSLNDIAKELNISNGTVKATLFQIKEKIKRHMKGK